MNHRLFSVSMILCAASFGAVAAAASAGRDAVQARGETRLANDCMEAVFLWDGHALRLKSIEDRVNHHTVEWSSADLFSIYIGKPGAQARVLKSSDMKWDGQLNRMPLKADPKSVRASGHLDGEALQATFTGEGFRVHWMATLRKGGVALRQELSVEVVGQDPVPVQRIELFDVRLDGVAAQGYTDGVPVANDHLFLGIEHPMANLKFTREFEQTANWSPAEMRARRLEIPLHNIPAGDLTAALRYQRGTHRIEASAMRIRDAQGHELGADVHAGYSGLAQNAYEYTVKLKDPLAEGVCVFELSHPRNEDDSWGEVRISAGQNNMRVQASWPRNFDLKPGTGWWISSAIGVYAPGQLRRTFNTYVEQERAHPYRQYWHYNSWFDLNINCYERENPLERMTEPQCLEVIGTIGREMKTKRGVGLDGYVWDDGWDEWSSLWQFHKGFPNGFARMDTEARKQGAGTGVWMSPWGGYNIGKVKRVEYGKKKGFETNETGFSMGGAHYYENFRNVCLNMIRSYAQNYFKFDGIGGGTYATGADERIAPDLDGLMRLIAELRAARPSLFINCTVGTWASPYWLWSADSIWRQGSDVDFKGVGNTREQWITYRDHEIYTRFASRSPLFPISSLMYHGVVLSDHGIAQRMPNAETAKDPDAKAESLNSFRHEAWMAAGLGSTLGELYISPRLMPPEYWDVLAEAVKWSRSHEAILMDNHWMGGAPERLEVYGYAAWTPKGGGVLTLRNPSDKPQTYALDIGRAFELPAGAPRKYRLAPVIRPAPANLPQEAEAGREAVIQLAPFEVIVLTATPNDD